MYKREKMSLLLRYIFKCKANSKAHGAIKQEIAKTPAKGSAHQIPSIVVIFAILVFIV
jgi:hypothetical protein